jgi:hypothetical protein
MNKQFFKNRFYGLTAQMMTMLTFLLIALTVTGCELFEDESNEPAFTEFSFAGQKGKAKISVKNRTIEVEAADTTTITRLIVTYKVKPAGTEVEVDTKPQVSGETPNDFTNPLDYILITPGGTTKTTWRVTVKGAGSSNSSRPLKSGSVQYQTKDLKNGSVTSTKEYFCWDDYGFKQRQETIDYLEDGKTKRHNVQIWDKSGGKIIIGTKDYD